MKRYDYLKMLVPELLWRDEGVKRRYRAVLRRLVRDAIVLAHRTVKPSADTNHIFREATRIAKELVP